MQSVDIPQVGLLAAGAECDETVKCAHAKEAKSKITNAKRLDSEQSGAFAFGTENREVIH